jgi:hypothetical protein
MVRAVPHARTPSNMLDDCDVKKDLVFLDDDVEVSNHPLSVKDVAATFKTVRVLDPYLVAYDGTAHYPNEVVEVPVSVADLWLRNRWVTAE